MQSSEENFSSDGDGAPASKADRTRYRFAVSHLGFELPARAFRAMVTGYRFWKNHGRTVRRARFVCQAADGLRWRRPPGWERRSERLYSRTTKMLAATLGAQPDTLGLSSGGDGTYQAHRALYLSQKAYRAMALGALGVVAMIASGACVVVLCGCWLSPDLRSRVFPVNLAAGRPWSVSTTHEGYPSSGVGPSSSAPFFFHTEQSDHPWIQIDLGEKRWIRSIKVLNRTDCCQKRALPLNIEVFNGNSWELVGQRRSPFAVWKYRVRPVQSRLVRFRVAGDGPLHLKSISIYGQ